MHFVGARILIIDEVHELLAGSYRQRRSLLINRARCFGEAASSSEPESAAKSGFFP
jgi:hypothetical protein